VALSTEADISADRSSQGRGAASGTSRQADSWYQRDRSVALALGERDEEMDDLHASLIAELASGPLTLPVATEMALVARCYERLAAHAVNIARRVGYLAGSATD
jgi:phosphate uptake regulator